MKQSRLFTSYIPWMRHLVMLTKTRGLDIVIAVENDVNRLYLNNGKGFFKDESSNRMPENKFSTYAANVIDFMAMAIRIFY